MDIAVRNIQINESINKVIVNVEFSQATDDGCTESASFMVYLRYDDETALGEIESAAIERSFEFLKTALAAHPQQNHP
jgi:hypothetical protein